MEFVPSIADHTRLSENYFNDIERGSPTGASTYQKGSWFEQIVLSRLKDLHFTLLESNYRIRGGELDLIMSKDNIIHVFEVKGSSLHRNNFLESSAGSFKLSKLHRTYNVWAYTRGYIDHEVKFWLATVTSKKGLIVVKFFNIGV